MILDTIHVVLHVNNPIYRLGDYSQRNKNVNGELNIMAPPEESVKIVVAAIECVQAGIRAAMPGKNTGADELIPCTIYILSRGKRTYCFSPLNLFHEIFPFCVLSFFFLIPC